VVLVTGGAGYIGSFVVRACVLAGMSAVVLDDASTGHFACVQRAAAGAPGTVLQAVRGRAGDQAMVAALVRDFGVTDCIHLAGSSAVAESVANPLKYFKNNTGEGLSLLEALMAVGVKRFVFSSSAAVYGHPARVPIAEDQPLSPIHPYGESKAMIEQALRRFHEAYGLAYAALRYFNAAGADEEAGLGEDHDPETHLIPLAIDAALGQRPGLTVFGRDYPTPDGTCIRDYVDVRDVAAAHVAALQALAAGTAVGAVNLGTGTGHSVLEVLGAVAAAVGQPCPTPSAPAVRAIRPRSWPAASGRGESWAGCRGTRSKIACAPSWPGGGPGRMDTRRTHSPLAGETPKVAATDRR
jgi:UDP-glucose 4-epimerase